MSLSRLERVMRLAEAAGRMDSVLEDWTEAGKVLASIHPSEATELREAFNEVQQICKRVREKHADEALAFAIDWFGARPGGGK